MSSFSSHTLHLCFILFYFNFYLFIYFYVVLLAGVKILFRVGLVLLKCMLGTQEKLKSCQGLYETMELLKAIQPQYTHEAFLVREVRFCYQFHNFDPAPNAHPPVFLGSRIPSDTAVKQCELTCQSCSRSCVSDYRVTSVRERH